MHWYNLDSSQVLMMNAFRFAFTYLPFAYFPSILPYFTWVNAEFNTNKCFFISLSLVPINLWSSCFLWSALKNHSISLHVGIYFFYWTLNHFAHLSFFTADIFSTYLSFLKWASVTQPFTYAILAQVNKFFCICSLIFLRDEVMWYCWLIYCGCVLVGSTDKSPPGLISLTYR